MANDDNVLDRRSSYSYGEAAPDAADEMGGVAAHSELRSDMDSYFRPLERVHGSALHGSGIARGLRLASATGPAGPCLLITPGTAIDNKGRHLSIAPQGWADKSLTEQPDPQNADNLVAVDADGLRVLAPAEASHSDSQKYYVVLSWLETPTTATAVGFPGGRTPGFPQKVHSPHVFFKKVEELPAGSQAIVLGVVSWTATGAFTVVSQELRRAAQVPVGDYGAIGSLPDGGAAGAGVVVSVPNPNDRVVLRTQDVGAFDLVEGKGKELSVNGTLRARGGLSVSGTLTLEGPVGLTVNGPLLAKGGLTVSNGLTLDGSFGLTVNGPVKASNGISVDHGGLSVTGGVLSTSDGLAISGFDDPVNRTGAYTITREDLRQLVTTTKPRFATGTFTVPGPGALPNELNLVHNLGTTDVMLWFSTEGKIVPQLGGEQLDIVLVEPSFNFVRLTFGVHGSPEWTRQPARWWAFVPG